jgi:HK97 gp10 family phage protein
MPDDAPRITADARSAIKGLETLDKKMGKKYVRKALRSACKVTLSAAKSTAPVASGLLKRNIKIRSAKSNSRFINMVVGVGDKWFTGTTFYAAFVAFGHKMGKRALGDSRKQIPANEWFEKAYHDTSSSAIDTFSEVLSDLIEKNE